METLRRFQTLIEAIERSRDASAARSGDFNAILALLDPDVVVRADWAAVDLGAVAEIRGAAAVADSFMKRAPAAQPALVNGAPGLAWAPRGQTRVVFSFTMAGGKIAAIDLIGDPARLGMAVLEG